MDKFFDAVTFDRQVKGAKMTFKGTHVPVSHLFQFLSLEPALSDFLKHYPQVKREQAITVLEAAREVLHDRFEAPLGIHAIVSPVVGIGAGANEGH